MKKAKVSDLIRWWKDSSDLRVLEAEVYIELLNEILVQYKNNINSIERTGSTP